MARNERAPLHDGRVVRTETRNLTVAVTAVIGLIGAIGATAFSAVIDPAWSKKNIRPLGIGVFLFAVATRSGAVLTAGYADNGTGSKWTDLRADRMSWDVAAVVPTGHVVEWSRGLVGMGANGHAAGRTRRCRGWHDQSEQPVLRWARQERRPLAPDLVR